MTIGLSYLDDLSRVRVALSDRADGTVLVERSATSGFQLPSTVRGGVALPISGGVGQLDDYEFFADVENWLRVTPVDPPAGLLLTGTPGDFASTPDTAVLDITGDIDIRIDATVADWTASQALIAKFLGTGNQRSWRVQLSGGQILFDWATAGEGGSPSETSTLFDTPGPGERRVIRVTLDADFGGEHVVGFWTGDTIDGPFTLFQTLGTGATPTSIFASTAPLEIGSLDNGASQNMTGTVHAAQVRNGVGGTVVADVDFAAQANRDTSFADDAGRTWTVSGGAEVVGIETDSITPSLAGLVWLKSIRYPLQNVAVRVADYGDIESPSRAAAVPVEGRALPTGVFEFGLGRDHELILRTTDQATEDHLKLMVRTGDWFFVHVPTAAAGSLAGNTLLPGSMYVMLGTPRIHRIGGVSEQHLFSLPLTEVTPPGPDVVGTTLTVGGLVALHGSVSSVWAAYPTIRDLWDTIGSLEDLVTI